MTRKAVKNLLQFETDEHPNLETIKACYKIYDDNMASIPNVSFDFSFFESLFTISYAKLILIKDVEKNIVSFGIILGNFLFIQSSTKKGKELGANNLLYDEIFKLCENNLFFFGTARKDNKGLYSFKINIGLKPIPTKTTSFYINYFLPKILRQNKIGVFFLRRMSKEKILNYILPY